MKFLENLKSRKDDIKTLSSLMESSLEHAASSGVAAAGAHHLALAAFEMNDTTAEEALATLNTTADDFRSALASLDENALAGIGITAPELQSEPVQRSRLANTDATYEAAIRASHDLHNNAPGRPPLQSAHVLAGVANVELGTSARVFAALDLDREAVIAACIEALR